MNNTDDKEHWDSIDEYLKERIKELEERYTMKKTLREDCLHRACSSCKGTGVRENGKACLHMLYCPCKNCTPFSLF